MRVLLVMASAVAAASCGGLLGPSTDPNGCTGGAFACKSPEVEPGRCCGKQTASGAWTDYSGSVAYVCAWGQDVDSLGCFATLEEAHAVCDCKPNPTPGYPPICQRDKGNPTGYVQCTK